MTTTSAAAHVVVMELTIETDAITAPGTDAVQRRIDRIHRNAVRASAIAAGDFPDPDGAWRARAMASLMADRAMLSAQLPAVAEQIACSPQSDQPELVAQMLRPITLAVEQAHLAIARLNTVALSR